MFLDKAVEAARKTLRARKEVIPFSLMEKLAGQGPDPISFKEGIRRKEGQPINVIAEIKRSSPSRGHLKNGFRVEDLVDTYARGGASALSILTETVYFSGSLYDLSSAVGAATIPVLRKDFIVDPYQVLESSYLGASAVLLIAAALTGDSLRELLEMTHDLHMDALVEVHDREDLSRALEAGADIVGINNRDLKTLEVDINRTLELLPLIPDGLVRVSESGIRTGREAKLMEENGLDALLVGEALMLAEDPALKIEELRGTGGSAPGSGSSSGGKDS